MADFAKARTMMVDSQVRPNDVTRYTVIEAMLTVPREAFVPDAKRAAAYVGTNLDLGGDRVLLEPRTLAKMLDALAIGPTDLVLDVACGHGYGAAVMARMAEAVVALDVAEMAAEAQTRLAANGSDNVAVVAGDPVAGAAKHAPYDVIVIEGGVQTVPQAICDQLKEGGRIAALFQDGGLGVVRIGLKQAGRVNWRDAFNATAPVLPGFARAAAFAF
ncbi:protein-L-isoaspartate O-methyltransferase [Paracoccus sp. p4-l81]|uniref:protein-L-isoaspartate O-methyltransferase family protein n=1 Tax=unclassified Paracoccus (in: a-proteobacteria) TaxID=2688777 RepID=UPI0035B8EDB2